MSAFGPSASEPHDRRPRARGAGLVVGRLAVGAQNSITDVEGVRVGHTTCWQPQNGVLTGVTAILPGPEPYEERAVAGGFALSGAGELSGLLQVMEWGLMETPIVLTNTVGVGVAADATVQWLLERHGHIGQSSDLPIPIVGECDDSWLNDITRRSVRTEHVFHALDGASTTPPEEGSVGAGAGMITCDFKAGIGTASRLVPHVAGAWTLGVLVQSNFGRMEDLLVDGRPLGRLLAHQLGHYARRRANYGSIIVVFATDAPLLPMQLNRLARRAALGLGRMGSIAAHGSGEIIVGFSTANPQSRRAQGALGEMRFLRDAHIDPLYEAIIEATAESVLNALCAAQATTGLSGRHVPAFPLDLARELTGGPGSPEQGRP